VADRGDSGGAMDVDSDVALVGYEWLAGVDPHPNANRAAEGSLSLVRCYERILRPGERDEEGVALRVDLDPTMPGEGLAQDLPMLSERVCIGIAELVEQLRRALDVGEEEGDGAGGELAHPSMIARYATSS
jgi:hypothetical protein